MYGRQWSIQRRRRDGKADSAPGSSVGEWTSPRHGHVHLYAIGKEILTENPISTDRSRADSRQRWDPEGRFRRPPRCQRGAPIRIEAGPSPPRCTRPIPGSRIAFSRTRPRRSLRAAETSVRPEPPTRFPWRAGLPTGRPRSARSSDRPRAPAGPMRTGAPLRRMDWTEAGRLVLSVRTLLVNPC